MNNSTFTENGPLMKVRMDDDGACSMLAHLIKQAGGSITVKRDDYDKLSSRFRLYVEGNPADEHTDLVISVVEG